ncbi:site-specific integrase [Micromonospora foliorum]|uniref:site-specific integrase n=1 Tax=Micromonospora foliorum TaxID=2911210 RepID=UPI0027E20A21|nr:site-specific integrase [Micromonospora foliorum]
MASAPALRSRLRFPGLLANPIVRTPAACPPSMSEVESPCNSWHPRRSGPGGRFRCRRRPSPSSARIARSKPRIGWRWGSGGRTTAWSSRPRSVRRWTRTTFDRTWHKIRAAAGLDWLRLHDLRHAGATFLLVSGASPRTVMKVLGHSQIGLTMNTYAHVLPEIERAAADEAAKHLFD